MIASKKPTCAHAKRIWEYLGEEDRQCKDCGQLFHWNGDEWDEL